MSARPKALVTGATSGIGAAYAERLARSGYDLIVTGRRVEVLNAAADAWQSAYGVRVEPIVAELARAAERAALAERIVRTPELEFLVNNAGFGLRSRFASAPIAGVADMVAVHASATLELCRAALPGMLERGAGSIVNVSSIASFIPYPGNAAYAATKALVSNFTETLAIELRGTRLRVQVLCPGLTRTDFHARMGESPETVYARGAFRRALTPTEVVDASIAALEAGKVVCVPGFFNRLNAMLVARLPRALVRRLVIRLFDADGGA
jgi:short-subunit dehydrogenase